MRAAVLIVLVCALSAFVPSASAQTQTALQFLQTNSATYSNYLASIKAVNATSTSTYEEIVALLSGTPIPPATSAIPISVFAPTNAVTGSASMTVKQVLFSIVAATSSLGSTSISGNFSFATGLKSTVLYTTEVGVDLGTTPNIKTLPPNTKAGSSAQNVYIVQSTTSPYTVSYDATQSPLTVSSADNAVTNGFVHAYSTGSIPTPPGSLGTLLSFYKTSTTTTTFSEISALIPSSTLAELDALNGITVLLPTNAGLAGLETLTGQGLQNYILSAAIGVAEALADLTSILSYHIIPTPGQLIAYSVPLENTLLGLLKINGVGAMNFTTALNISNEFQAVQISISSSAPYTLSATSFAPLTSPLTIGGSTTPIDQLFGAGVIHGLNGILLPTGVTLYLPKAIAGLGATLFIQYLTSTGLIATLSSSTPYTVLVPSDTAFEAIANSTFITNTTILTAILQLHIIPGVQSSSPTSAAGAILPANKYTTISGGTLTVSAQSGSSQTVSVSGGTSTATLTDASASLTQNGFAYSISGILIPAQYAAAPTPTPTKNGASSSSFCLSTVLFAVGSALVASLA